MASHYQTVPPVRQQTKYPIASDVKQSTHRLSIKQNDSLPLTSAKLFICRRNTTTNANGNLIFPLKEKHEAYPKPTSKLVWHDLLNYLKSQRIVKNLDIFKKTPKTPHDIKAQQSFFPLENAPKSKTHFPCRLSNENNSNFIHANKKDYKKSIPNKSRKHLKFPLKLSTGSKDKFLHKTQALKEKWKNPKHGKLHQVNQLEAHFPTVKKENSLAKELFLATQSSFHMDMNKLKPPYKSVFSIHENSKKITTENDYVLNCENKFVENKFPCVIALQHGVLKKFPLKNERTIVTSSLSLEPPLSLSMTQKGQHVSQVQDLQILPTTTTTTPPTFEHQQTPPQITNAKTTCDDSNVYKLSAIKAINNTRSNEVGLFEEKIEYIQDAIVALFEKIQNSFRNTHISKHDEKTNAINRNDHDDAVDANDGNSNGNGVARFALTPPTNSTTSVRNTESILRGYNNNNNVYNKNICDLGDLCYDASDQRGKIVERSSDVRDTLAETVDNGDKNENRTTSTGSFLVKSEEPIPPYIPEPQPLNESISTSLERSDILPKYNVLPPVNIVNSNVININSEIYINEIPTETEINEKKLSTTEESEVMTITRLEDNETDNLQSREEFIDLEIDEMKYEMNRTKGAVTSTLTEPRAVGKRDSLMTGNTNTNYGRNVSSNLPTRPLRDSNSSTPSLSAVQRLTLKSENLRSPVSAYLPSDATTNRSNLTLNDALSSRSSTTSPKTINISNDALANRRPSLNSLRNTQSTSLLSQDLTHYTPAAAINQKDQTSLLGRGASIDSSLDDVLPERTRLRRQRRLRPLDSLDEPEDPIERLNRLKARISASLSEVKGVLKQYSTEGEAENENVTSTIPAFLKENPKEEKKEDEGPVTFRFIKKIRRRSLFSEEEEEKAKENEQKIEMKAGNDEVDHQPKINASSLEIEELQTDNVSKEQLGKSNEIVESTPNSLEEIGKKLYTLKEEIPETLEETSIQQEEGKKEIEIKTMESQRVTDKSETFIEDVSPDTKTKTRKKSITKPKDVSSKESVLVAEDLKASVPEALNETQLPIGGKVKDIENLDEQRVKEKKEIEIKTKEIQEIKDKSETIIEDVSPDTKTKTRNKSITKPKDVSSKEPVLAAANSRVSIPETLKETQPPIGGEVKDIKKLDEKPVIPKGLDKTSLQLTGDETSKGAIPKQLETNSTKAKKKDVIKVKDGGHRESLQAKQITPVTIQEAQESSKEIAAALTEVKAVAKKEENKEILKAGPISETSKGALAKEPESDVQKIKRKIIIKPKDPLRRASLAAVEGSKIEPAVKVAIPAKIVRRPSDSEAVVKKKLITAKINTSGSVEEVTPKPKIVKVKRSSTKSNAQLATTQAKIIEEESAMTAAAAENVKSNDRVKSIDKQKSMHNDKGKDVVLMPNESKNNEITSQTNLLLPTQLVIDETASLQAKTIENSQLQSNQKQEQAQVQKQNQQQATIKSTTTKFKSNELQQTGGDGGAMLENLTTTALSSTKTAEANGQEIKRENGNALQEDLNDLLLQQETTIIKPSGIKQEQQQQINEKSLENRETTVATAEKYTQQQVVKIDEISNNETERSSKEPCVDKLPTSTHIVTHEKHQQQHHQPVLVEGEQSITHETDTKAISSPHISISSTADSTQSATTISKDELPEDSEEIVNQVPDIKMPELQVTPAPVQTAELSPQPEQHKKKVILKKIVRQSSIDKTKKPETKTESQPLPETEVSKAKQEDQNETENVKEDLTTEVTDRVPEPVVNEELNEDISESTEISESSTSQGSEETTEKPKKERKVKQKVIIKRQKRRLSIGDNFFHPATAQEPQNAEVETLEKPISYVTDDDDDNEESIEDDEDEKKKAQEEEEQQKKPLKSCIMQKVYNIGDEVLYAERFKKTQIKWRRGRIKERITSISYLLDIDGKDVSSHINYLKKFTGRKVSFGGKEYLEIDYEQLAEEEEKAEKLQRRTYSIWNMV